MTTSRFERFLPYAGVLAGLLFIVMAVATNGAPSASDKSAATLTRWTDTHDVRVAIAGFAAGYFCVVMLLFAAGIRSALRSGEAGESSYSSAAFAGGILLALSVAMMGWVQLAAMEAAHDSRDGVVQTLGYLSDFGWIPWVASSAVLLLAAGLGGLRTGILPRWLGVVTLVLGVLCLLGPTGIAVYFAEPFWFIVTGIVLGRRQTATVAARVPTPAFATA